MADPYVDAVYIGDPTISERTMAQFGYYHQTNQFLLEVAPSEPLFEANTWESYQSFRCCKRCFAK